MVGTRSGRPRRAGASRQKRRRAGDRRVTGVPLPKVTVAGVNADAPLQFRLRCRLSPPWPAGFTACSDEVFKALGKPPSGAW
ncbi:hypothetical protein THIOKS12330005 [Thiocapsa sp. KS1]|nr:hypothetical protein THIOKS12330005 [Thiocapsa sp. KS1]